MKGKTDDKIDTFEGFPILGSNLSPDSPKKFGQDNGGAPMETTEVEKQLLLISGVRAAKVVGDDSPTEIHIMAHPGRPVRQIVRDVQSLLAAGFGFEIDHRIVSVVAPESGDQKVVDLAQPETPDGKRHRTILEKVTTAIGAQRSWVKVDIRWSDGDITHGASYMGSRVPERARSSATALIIALMKKLSPLGVTIELDELVIHRIGNEESVIVRAVFADKGKTTLVAGTAVILDDVVTASARAVLHAVNRNLELTWRDAERSVESSPAG